jgi:prepilin-type N-terminal cleavage/methylation domain-containing protein
MQPVTRNGMTLLEILVAVTLLGIVMAGMTMAFRSGIKTFETGIRHEEGTLTARAAVTMLLDDLRNIHFLPENRYNVTYRQRMTIVEQRAQQAAQAGRQYDPLTDPDAPDPGLAIDLSFRVDNGGKADKISFVRNQGDRTTDDRLLFGLARVTWSLDGDVLTRTIEDVTAAPVDPDGNELPKAVEPRTDRVATHVDSFNLRMGYWFEENWILAEDWDSRLNTYRNPIDEDLALELDLENSAIAAQGVGDTIQAQLNQRGLMFIPDNLPAWVEVTIGFRDPKNPSKVTVYRNVVQFPMAQETNFDQELMRGDAGRPGNRRRVNP